MIFVCVIHTIFSLFCKILLDTCIDDYLRRNSHKSLAKKRKWRDNLTHSDIKNLIPRRYVLFNYAIYCLLLLVAILTIFSFFVSTEVNCLLKDIGCFIIITECFFIAMSRICEVLFYKHTRLWNKVLLAIIIIAVLIFLFFWG